MTMCADLGFLIQVRPSEVDTCLCTEVSAQE